MLDHLQQLTSRYQEETDHLYNLEATPAEGTSYRLAKIDKNLYSEIKASGNGTPYYTNSTALPVGISSDVLFALEHQDKLQPLYTGGTVFHTFLGEAVADTKALKNFIVKAFTNNQDPLPLHHPDLQRLPRARLRAGRALRVPHLWRGFGGLHPHRRLLPPREPLEQGQTGRVRRPSGVRGRLLAVRNLMI